MAAGKVDPLACWQTHTPWLAYAKSGGCMPYSRKACCAATFNGRHDRDGPLHVAQMARHGSGSGAFEHRTGTLDN
jgi:hypothetical protein